MQLIDASQSLQSSCHQRRHQAPLFLSDVFWVSGQERLLCINGTAA
jgi:hypothetical protein